MIRSQLLGLVALLLGGVVRVLYVRVGACAVRVLQEQVDVALLVDQHLILDHAPLLQVLQLHETHLLIIHLEHPLGLLGGASQPAQDESLVLGHSDHHEPAQRDRQFEAQEFGAILGDDVPLDGVEGAELLVVASADDDLVVVDAAGATLAAADFHVGDGGPLRVDDIVELRSLHLDFILAVVPPEDVDLLGVVDRREEVAEGRHLRLVEHQLLVGLEDSEVLARRPAQQEVAVAYGDEHHREVQREPLPLVPVVDLPFLARDAEPPDARPPELKPVAALVQHQGRVLVVVLLGLCRHLVLLARVLLLVVLGHWEGERGLEGVGDAGELLLQSLRQVVVVLVVEGDEFVARLAFLLATQLLLEEKRLNLAERGPLRLLKAEQDAEELAEGRRVKLLQDLQILSDQLLTIDLDRLLIEPRHFVHQSQLDQHQACAEHI